MGRERRRRHQIETDFGQTRRIWRLDIPAVDNLETVAAVETYASGRHGVGARRRLDLDDDGPVAGNLEDALQGRRATAAVAQRVSDGEMLDIDEAVEVPQRRHADETAVANDAVERRLAGRPR